MAKKDDDWTRGWNAAWKTIFGREYSTKKTYKVTPKGAKWAEYWRDLGFVKIPPKVKAARKRQEKKRRAKRGW